MDSLAIEDLLQGWEQPEEEVSSPVQRNSVWPVACGRRRDHFPVRPGRGGHFQSGWRFQSRREGFWFNVNAELVIYGLPQRDATVAFADGRLPCGRMARSAIGSRCRTDSTL